ncbi:phage tail length tape measure family protein [Sphingopyxis granuli]|nr:phage tail length tape measure family protein [Sphingopyxis granuli]
MAETVGSLLVRLGLDSGAFRSGLTVAEKDFKAAQKRFEKIGEGMQSFGKKLSVGLTLPLTALGAAAVKGALDQRAAMGQVEAALASMGNVSGKTADQLAKAADAMEMHSLFDADAILTKVTANLLTFGNVAGEQFDRAQQAAIDMATRMGSDPQSAAVMLGKALNDPIKGISALTKVGVQFSAEQKKQIEAFQKTGQTAKAQGIILTEVERQFKGAAQAAADTQPWRQAKVAIDQAMDGIGEAILPVIPVIADAIKSLATSFAELSPGMQKAIVIGGAVAAALGPIITVFGGIVIAIAPMLASISTTVTALGGWGAAFGVARAAIAGFLTGFAPAIPVIAAFAAAAYAVYANWDKISPVLQEVWKTIVDTLGPPLQQIVSTVTTMLTELWNGPLGDLARGAITVLGEVGAALLKVFGPVILGALKLMLTQIGNTLTALLEFGRAIGSLFRGDIQGAFEHLGSAINNLFGGLPAKVIGWIAEMVRGIGQWMGAKLNAIWDGVKKKVDAVTGWFRDMYVAVVGNSFVPDMVDEIGQHMRRLDKELVDPARKATGKAAEAFRALQEEVADILARLFPEQAAHITFDKERAALDAYHKAGKLSADAHAAAVEALKREYLGLDRDRSALTPGQEAPGITLSEGSKSIEEMVREAQGRFVDVMTNMKDQAQITKVSIVQTFEEMAQGVLDALDQLAGAIKGGGFLNILKGVIGLGLQLGKTGLFGSKIQTSLLTPIAGARALGGPVMSGRPYLVGEKGPELFTPRSSGRITPNNELGGGRVEVRIVPTPYFDAHVDGRASVQVASAAPGIASAGASAGLSKMQRKTSRRLA